MSSDRRPRLLVRFPAIDYALDVYAVKSIRGTVIGRPDDDDKKAGTQIEFINGTFNVVPVPFDEVWDRIGEAVLEFDGDL